MLEQLKNVFRRNKIQKCVALISSAALWFYVMDTQNPIINGSYEVPLSSSNVQPKFKAIFPEQTVQVRLSAPRSYFIDYGVNNIHAFANMRNYNDGGEYDVPIDVSYPKGFELESVTPNTVHVQLDPFVEFLIEPEIRITGAPAKDSVVTGFTKSSDKVTLVGPQTSVDKVARVIGYAGLRGESQPLDILTPLTPVDKDGRELRDVRVAPSTINVQVQIESELRQKTVPVEADITVPTGRELLQVIVAPSTIELIGKQEDLDAIDSVRTEPLTFIVNAKTFIGKLRLIIPEGVTASYDEVDVTCRFKE